MTMRQSQVPSPQNRYLYNGKELQEATGWMDYGARMYDGSLGRFFTQDRFSEKYLDFSPYQYAAGNPVKYIDVNGDSLEISGSQEAQDKFIKAVNEGLGGFYTAQVDKESGLVTLKSTEKEGEMSNEHKAFYDNFSVATDSEGKVKIEIVQNDQQVLIGDYNLEKIDIEDVNKFGSGPLLTKQGALIHEVTEQTAKQLYGLEHGYATSDKGNTVRAHDIANNSENKVNGSKKTKQQQFREYIRIIGIDKNGNEKKAVILYEKNNIKNVYR